MSRAGLAALVRGTDLYHVFASPFHYRESFRLRANILDTRLERWYREYGVVRTSTSIYSCEESLSIRAICVTYRARSAGDDWGRKNRSVARPAKCLLGGVPGVGICPGRHSAVHFYAT